MTPKGAFGPAVYSLQVADSDGHGRRLQGVEFHILARCSHRCSQRCMAARPCPAVPHPWHVMCSLCKTALINSTYQLDRPCLDVEHAPPWCQFARVRWHWAHVSPCQAC